MFSKKFYLFALGVWILLILLMMPSVSNNVWQTEAAQQDWKIVLGGLPAQAFGSFPVMSCPDPSHCWLVAYNLGGFAAWRTSDGGLTWQNWGIPGFTVLNQVSFYNSNSGYAGYGRQLGSPPGPPEGLAQTKDGGTTWQKVNDKPILGFFLVDDRVAYFNSTDGVYKTSDGGDTWQFWTSGELPRATQFLDENIAWTTWALSRSSDPENYIAFTVDGGKNWTRVFPEAEDSRKYWSIFFLDYMNGWAGGGGGVLARTRDAGQTWEIIQLSSSWSPGNINFLNSLVGFSSLNNRITLTVDGGRTWQDDGSGELGGIQLVTMHDQHTGWAVTRSQVLKRSPGIALTPTATFTPVPGTTPTPTRTPFIPPIPTPTSAIAPTATPLLPTPTPTPTPGPEARQNVIPRLYREVLCRGIDTQGYQYWLNSPLTTEQIRQELINSPEGQRVAAVRTLYTSILARDPMSTDCGGLRFWVDSDLTLDAIRAGLEVSGEGQRVAAVRQLYIELLGRDPLGSDNAGLRYWAQLPLPISDIRRLIMESEEYRQRHGG